MYMLGIAGEKLGRPIGVKFFLGHGLHDVMAPAKNCVHQTFPSGTTAP